MMISGTSAAAWKTITQNANTLVYEWSTNGTQRLTYNDKSEILVTESEDTPVSFSKDKKILIYHFEAMNSLLRTRLKSFKAESISDLHAYFGAIMKHHAFYKMANRHYHEVRTKIMRLQARETRLSQPKGLSYVQKQLNSELEAIIEENYQLLFSIMDALGQRIFSKEPILNSGWYPMALVAMNDQFVNVECNLGIQPFDKMESGFPLTDTFEIRFANKLSTYLKLSISFNFSDQMPDEISAKNYTKTVLNPGQYVAHEITAHKTFKPISIGYKPFSLALQLPDIMKIMGPDQFMICIQVLVELALLQDCASLDVYASNRLAPMMYACGFESADTIEPTMKTQAEMINKAFEQKTPIGQLNTLERHDQYGELLRLFKLDMTKIALRPVIFVKQQCRTTWTAAIGRNRLLLQADPILPMLYELPTQPFTPSFKSIQQREHGRSFKQNGTEVTNQPFDFSSLISDDALRQSGQAARWDDDVKTLLDRMSHLTIRSTKRCT